MLISLVTCAVACFVAAIAGNLVLIGSAANLIVANASTAGEKKQAKEQSRRERTVFAAGRHAKFGVPLTLITCAVGVSILIWELKTFKSYL